MSDVVIIGGGHAGCAIAAGCMGAKLSVTIVDDSAERPDGCKGDWIPGRGVISGSGLVAVLDPETGDERRIIPAIAIVLATGILDPTKPSNRMLGVTKAGAEFAPDGTTVKTDHHGRTRAPGIYATGSCASSATPDIVADIIEYCAASVTK